MRPVAHHADDQHAGNRAQKRSLAARKRRAADDGRGNDVGFEAKAIRPACPLGRKARLRIPANAAKAPGAQPAGGTRST